MRYVRVMLEGRAQWGVLEGETVRTLKSAPYEGLTDTGVTVALADCTLLEPCTPSKIVCVGKNYFDHALEMKEGVPDRPILFMKTPNCLNRPEGAVEAPAFVTRLDYEGELAFVVGRRAKDVKAAQAMDYIFGYTCLNDVTARDIQKGDGQWTRGKCMDGFCPVGPILTDEVDPADLVLETRLNGQTVQSSRTSLLMTGLPALMEFITASFTLEAGDVVTTGTPAGVGPMVAGDVVEVEIQGIGVLRNQIR